MNLMKVAAVIVPSLLFLLMAFAVAQTGPFADDLDGMVAEVERDSATARAELERSADSLEGYQDRHDEALEASQEASALLAATIDARVSRNADPAPADALLPLSATIAQQVLDLETAGGSLRQALDGGADDVNETFDAYRNAAAALVGSLSTAESQVASLALPAAEDIDEIVNDIFTQHLVAFEVLGVLLTAAMIGALVIARPMVSGQDSDHYPRADKEELRRTQETSELTASFTATPMPPLGPRSERDTHSPAGTPKAADIAEGDEQ